MTLSISLLGSLHVTYNGQPVSLPTRKAGALLAYLALHLDVAVPRAQLATLLWPDSEKARSNLRAELVRLRRAIGDHRSPSSVLHTSRHSITLHSEGVAVDIERILHLLDGCAAHRPLAVSECASCCDRLALAVDLYHAPLLDHFDGINSLEFETLLAARRREYEQHILSALETLQVHLAARGAHEQVIKYARRHLALRPWLEAPTLRLMTALTLSNARDEAVDTYDALRRHLKDEFGAKPDASLVEMYEQIRLRQISAPARTTPVCPYPGLAAFGPGDAQNFYGREAVVQRLAAAVSQQPLVLFTGPSGSGKSSVVQAGLLPGLMQQNESSHTHWSMITIRPGRDPLRSVAHAIFPIAVVEDAAADMATVLRHQHVSLRQIIDWALVGPGKSDHGHGKHILLVVDQFEEIFTLCDDEALRRLFLTALFDHAGEGQEQGLPVSILIVLRADFMGQALSYRSFSRIAHEPVIFLGMMDDEQLRVAIEKPARQNGVEYEPGLIERIVADLDDSPGQLPLLQFALALLWEKRTTHWITHDAYNDIEQVSGALTHYANGVVARLTRDEQERVRRIFLQLVHPGEGVEDTRRVATRAEIGADNWPLVHKLAGSRLVVTNRDRDRQETVEVVHEALIRQWGRLRQWLEEDRVFRLWQNRARTALRLWQQAAQDADALLRGLALAEAERWLRQRRDELGDELLGFILASLQARQQQEALERRRRRELELALAESHRQERRALARQLGAQADQLMTRKCDLALLLSVEALRRSDRMQDRTDLLTTLEINPFLEEILHGHRSPVFYVSFGADGRTLISADERNHVLVWSMDSFAARSLLDGEHASADDVALDPTGRWVATVHGRQVALWDIATRRARVLVPDHRAAVFRLRFSSDGAYLLSIAEDGELCLWQTQTGAKEAKPSPLPVAVSLQVGPGAELLATAEGEGRRPGVRLRRRRTGAPLCPALLGHREMIHGLALSRDGSRLATASFDGTVRLWDTGTGKESAPPLTAHKGRALFAVFSPDGRWLATGGSDNAVFLWDVASGQQLDFPPFQHNNWVRCAVFSADGGMLASGDSDGKLYLWNLTRHRRLPGHGKRVRVVDVSPDGQILATVSFDGSVGLWDTSTHTRWGCLSAAPDREIMVGRFSPDRGVFAALDNQGQLLLWDTATWRPRPVDANLHNEPSIALAFSPDSRLLAQGDFNGYASLWDVASGQMIRPPTYLHTGVTSWVLCLTFSPDGATLASGSNDCTIAFWSAQDLAPVGPRIDAHANWVTHLLYTADGQTVISTSSDGTVRFWNPHSGAESAPPLIGHQGQVWQAEFSPREEERVLVTLGGDGSVIWWDLESRTPLAPPLRTYVETESMALHPDGKWIYLASFDEMAHAWQRPHGSWRERFCQIANRSLSRAEWETYLGNEAYRETRQSPRPAISRDQHLRMPTPG